MATTISVPVVPWHVSAGVISHNGRRDKTQYLLKSWLSYDKLKK